MWFKDFALDNDFDPDYLSIWAEENEKFLGVYKAAKHRQESRLINGGLTNVYNGSIGSSLRVGTSLRSSTFQYLHISEFGKICAKYPDKAREIMTGSLNTIGVGQYCFIESTAEGREGYFYDMCKQAQAMCESRKELSKLDFKFHFFPWWREPGYRIGSSPSINQDMQEYFLSLIGKGIRLGDEQKNWYSLRSSTQSDDMKREFPSTPDECREVSNLGTYYAKQITQARIE